ALPMSLRVALPPSCRRADFILGLRLVLAFWFGLKLVILFFDPCSSRNRVVYCLFFSSRSFYYSTAAARLQGEKLSMQTKSYPAGGGIARAAIRVTDRCGRQGQPV